jgi:hypothetical protein
MRQPPRIDKTFGVWGFWVRFLGISAGHGAIFCRQNDVTNYSNWLLVSSKVGLLITEREV